MYILLIIYILILLLEGILGLEPILEFRDFSLSYNLLTLIMINFLFLLRFIVKPFGLPIRNEIVYYYLGLLITFFPVILFKSHLIMGGLSLLIQFFLQSLLLLIIYKTFQKKEILRLYQFLQVFAFLNCLIVYGSYFFPDIFIGVAEVHGYFGYIGKDNERIIRAFGIMGDVAPWFLSFFSILSIQMKKYFYFALFGGTCLLGASIGASALVIIAVYFYFLFPSKKKFAFIFKSITLIGFIVLIVMAIKPELLFDVSIMKRLADPTTFKSASGAQRLYTYGLALNMISASPVWGSGYGTFLYNLQSSLGYEFFNLKFGAGSLSNSNNQILQVLYEGGIILLALFIFMIRRILLIFSKQINWYRNQGKMIEFKKASFIWFLSFVVVNQTAVWMIPSLIWVLIVSIIGITLYINKNIEYYEGNTPYSYH